MKDSPLNIEVSCFANTKSTEPKPVNLLTWLTSDKYKTQVEVIRQAATKDERTLLKQRLPGITPSGTFLRRKSDLLLKHSGLLCIDIDQQDNKHIGNYSDLKKQLCKIQNFAYVGLSVSGTGYFCLVPIAQPDQHKLHFKAMANDLERFGIKVDMSGSDLARLRFYSYDNEAYFNHKATVYTKLYTEQKKKPQPLMRKYSNDNTNKPLDICVNMVRGAMDGEKHNVLYKASRLAGGYIAGNQIDEIEAAQALETAIKNKSNVTSLEEALKTIKDGIEVGKSSPIEKPISNESVNNVKSVNSVTVSNNDYSFELIPKKQEHKKIQPVKTPKGRLALLIDIFCNNKQIKERLKVASLIDSYLRMDTITKEQLDLLESLVSVHEPIPGKAVEFSQLSILDKTKTSGRLNAYQRL
ncbi:MAG: hypothetical protein CVT99_15465 [Bacteroidetes bacterium HGW-Bacteroidetes-16]|jgi:hypothetical protein|nr:MAG: hypothetical protein CVT99_15465 [Bacteroidetes bacterium HGW-Bacteroidetes-16]